MFHPDQEAKLQSPEGYGSVLDCATFFFSYGKPLRPVMWQGGSLNGYSERPFLETVEVKTGLYQFPQDGEDTRAMG